MVTFCNVLVSLHVEQSDIHSGGQEGHKSVFHVFPSFFLAHVGPYLDGSAVGKLLHCCRIVIDVYELSYLSFTVEKQDFGSAFLHLAISCIRVVFSFLHSICERRSEEVLWFMLVLMRQQYDKISDLYSNTALSQCLQIVLRTFMSYIILFVNFFRFLTIV